VLLIDHHSLDNCKHTSFGQSADLKSDRKRQGNCESCNGPSGDDRMHGITQTLQQQQPTKDEEALQLLWESFLVSLIR